MNSQRRYYALTHPQKAIWYMEKVYSDTSIGNVAATLRIKGAVDFLLLEKAVNMVIEKNDALRLRIVEQKGEPKQYISEYTYQKFDFFDFSDKELDELYKWDEQLTKIPVNLVDSDLFYFALLKIDNQDCGVYGKFHHLISDAWTMSLIGNQIMEYYCKLKGGEEITREKKPSYIEYIQSEEEYKKSDKFEKAKEFWNNKFETVDELTTLKPRTTNTITTKARRKTFITPVRFTQKLYKYCDENKTSVFTLFLSALSLYINRIAGKEDIIIGTTVLNRSNFKEKNTVGMFISTVPIRLSISENTDFKTFEENVSKEWLAALRYQKYPYDILLKEIREKNNITENLYDIVLSYQNAKFSKDKHSEEYTTRWHFNGHQVNSLSIHISDREEEGHLLIEYDFLSDLFHVKEIEFIHQHIISLLWHAIDNPTKKISKIEMLSEREKHKILFDFNDTKADYPKDKTIHQLFEEQVEKTPDKVAVVFEDKHLTYRELNVKANQLARLLREKGVKPDNIVGLLVHRSLEMIIGMLGIMKSGGAYLPIDPDYPKDRIEYILQDSETNILLTEQELKDKINFNGEIINIKDYDIFRGNTSNVGNVNTPNDLIYVIHTSGSTGKPKGVMLEHKSVNNFIKGITDKIDFSPNKTILSVTTISFDIFVLESLLPLTKGLKVVIANEEEQKIPRLMYEVIKRNDVNMVQMTPSRMQLLINDEVSSKCLENMTEVMIGGEAFPDVLLEKLKIITKSKIYNMYGPTETTVWSTLRDVTDNDEINIGKPIINTKIYILDNHLNLVPIGVPGELYIGGDGLARGYLNKPELMQGRFIENLFLPGEKIYRTGDLARWYPQGDIEHLGRTDFQVKIRGFRVELEEIESKLLSYDAVKEAVVIDREDKHKNKYLCAYIVLKYGKEVSISKLRDCLFYELPNYMLPSIFMKLDSMPLTPNGKINRKALPEPNDNIALEIEYSAPTNDVEEKLAQAWAELFEVDRIGIDDNFFELGGDSLLIIQLQTKLLAYNWNLKTQDIYQYKTIRELSNRIRNLNKCDDASIVKIHNEYIKENSGEEHLEKTFNQKNQYNYILLTGATGFLGIHILDYILTKTNSKVYCLVRGEVLSDAENRLSELLKFYFSNKHNNAIGERIFVVNGDVASENLGINKNEYIELGKKIDTIIHTAAIVKYYGNYSDFKNVNIFGTENVIKFSLEFNKPLNYISTLGVSGNYLVSQTKENVVFTENDLYIGQNYMENVYVASKVEAEELINNYIKRGLKVNIFRVGNLTGRYKDGHFQKNISDNSFYNILKSIIQSGVISQNILDQKLEFSPVDICSQAIVELLFSQNEMGRVFHIFNHNIIKVSDMLSIFEKIGINIKALSKDSYKEVIITLLNDKSKRGMLKGIVNDFDGENQLSFYSSIILSSKITLNYLNQLGIKWPKVDSKYMEKIINYMKRVGYLGQ